jgi:FixJ family two-component response regulator
MAQQDALANVVHLVEDDQDQRHALAAMLRQHDMMVVESATAEAMLGLVASTRGQAPCCAVVDMRLPGLDGLGLLRALAVLRHAIPVVIITAYANVPLTVAAMRLGATDVLEKPLAADQLIQSVRRALALSTAAVWNPAERAEAEARIAALSAREREVLGLLVGGFANKAIAHRLGLSVRTVEGYRGTMMEKLGANSLAAAVRLAIAAGIGPPGPGTSTKG